MIGRKNRRVTFEEAVQATDSVGDTVSSWVPIATVWASLEPLRGEEAQQAQQAIATVTHRLRFRWSVQLDALTPKHRARYGSRVLDIRSVSDIGGMHREIEVMATEQV